MHLPALLALVLGLFVYQSSLVGARAIGLQERDDNLPARVPYVFPAPGTNEIADDIRARRANGTLLALDGVLLNAPLVAKGWNDLAGVIRDQNSLPGTMRELLILRVGVLNDAAYEWLQHEPVGRQEGLTTDQLKTIRLTPAFASQTAQKVLGPQLTAAMDFCDWITKTIDVPDRVFNTLRGFLNDQQMVEATATAGFYALVSRFVEALDVDGKANTLVPVPQ
ncbi:hypothetical protein AN958_02685 [Leucoagaricus sp. SymC.cos]|nr:hypothetical protein AN958_02685 [Leucoagaricus sp. SymC.cos]